VDAVLDIVHALDVPPAQCWAGRVGPMTYPRPTTGLEAKFSMPYVIAAAVVDRGLPIAAFTDEDVRRPDAVDRSAVLISNLDELADLSELTTILKGEPVG
jgi:hypothetical protein